MEAQAAETIRILAAGAVQGAILRLEPAIAVASTAKFDAVFDTVGALRDRVLGGDAGDIVILSEPGLAALEKAGKIAGPAIDLGSISVALAARKGARVPDVGSPDALRQALLSVGSIAHADPARGATARGRFEIGVSQSSEIVAHPGVTLVGRLPAPHHRRTRYLAAKLVGGRARADAVLAVLQTAAARSVFAEFGFEADR